MATSQQAELIAGHANAMLDANLRMNLTRVVETDGVLRLHIADSATIAAAVDQLVAGRIVDIGAGAGYPGFVLEILSGREMTLVESVRKKALFLEETAKGLGLPTEVIADRAEHVAVTHPEAFAGVVARAVSSLPALVELAAPLLKPGGGLIAMKGPITAEELSRGDDVGLLCGMRRVDTRHLELSAGEKRTIIQYAKVGRPRVSLPRRAGLAQRQPLA